MNRTEISQLCNTTLEKLTNDAEQNEYLLLALIQKLNNDTIVSIGDLWNLLSYAVEDIYSEALNNSKVLHNSDVKSAESFEYLMEEIEKLKDEYPLEEFETLEDND